MASTTQSHFSISNINRKLACAGASNLHQSLLSPSGTAMFFFFSSRRRHTRLVSDWSSDMCSSDRSEEHTSELQSLTNFVCRLLLGVQTCALPIHRERRRLYVSH